MLLPLAAVVAVAMVAHRLFPGAVAWVGAVGATSLVPDRLRDWRPLAAAAAVLLLCHGLQLPAEAAIRETAWKIGLLFPCPN